ncbi:UNVERIFIED_CONTAM: stage V sporulation protein B [Halobacillus marinus]|uniref:stage V sporulation protein B n=1 Tax=Bacillaceae TaxID=186817 RepID=UPI0002A4DBC1|nr:MULTISPECIES: stage V sporulation protein B [Bacillaceae]ELK44802.1 stage V sporulation protein B [Halobacillus sp. BAB-2008]QHT47268.1 stage V sporulation protein B [Bacillus sp. SB49]
MSKQTFLHGALILVAAGLITRLLGFINRIVVARVMGAEGVGLYMMALPTLILAITITQFGLPVAISKRVSEAEAGGDERKIKRILAVSLSVTGTLSILFTALLFIMAPVIANHFLTDSRALYPLLVVTPIIPIIAVSSVIRGYFQGRQNMKPQAMSQVIEQVVRIGAVVLLTKLLYPYGVQFAAAGAMASAVLGELASLFYMLRQFNVHKRFRLRKTWKSHIGEGRKTLNELMTIALPTTGSRFIGSLTYFFEPILVAQSLAIAGIAAVESTKQYGELTGYVLPLLFLPTFLTHALSISLVPSISEAQAQGKTETIQYRIMQSIRLSIASGGVITIIFMIFPAVILMTIYGTSSAAFMLQFMAPFFLLHYIQTPLQATLQALDLAKPAMWNTLIGSVVKFVVLVGLSSRPEFGIHGVALAIVVGVVVVTLLHMAVLIKYKIITFPVSMFLKFAAVIGITGYAGMTWKHAWLDASKPVSQLLTMGVTLTVFYLFLLFFFQLLRVEEWKMIPWKRLFHKK